MIRYGALFLYGYLRKLFFDVKMKKYMRKQGVSVITIKWVWKSRSKFLFRSRRDKVAYCRNKVPLKHALSLLLRSNEDMGKKIKAWSAAKLLVMMLVVTTSSQHNF